MGPSYHVKTTVKEGRGLYASLDIKKNNIITECELLVLNELDAVLVNQTDLKFYTFVYEGKKDCLVLGDGELFNHSNNPNVGYTLQLREDRKVMVFYALRDIQPTDQLTIDYSADTKVNVSEYMNNNLY